MEEAGRFVEAAGRFIRMRTKGLDDETKDSLSRKLKQKKVLGSFRDPT